LKINIKWWNWYIVCLCWYKRRASKCDGLLLKNVMKIMCKRVQCDGTCTKSVMALICIWKKKVQCDGTSTLCVEKEKVQCDGTGTKSVMALICIWKKKYSVKALVHCVLKKKEYSVMALVQKVWWHLFTFGKRSTVWWH